MLAEANLFLKKKLMAQYVTILICIQIMVHLSFLDISDTQYAKYSFIHTLELNQNYFALWHT